MLAWRFGDRLRNRDGRDQDAVVDGVGRVTAVTTGRRECDAARTAAWRRSR